MPVSSLLLANVVLFVAPAPTAQGSVEEGDAIDQAVQLYEAGDHVAASEALSALLDPADTNVNLSPKQWHTLLKFAARSFLAAGDRATLPEARRQVFSRGIQLCERYEESVVVNLADDDELAAPRDCAVLKAKAAEMGQPVVNEKDPLQQEKPQEAKEGPGAPIGRDSAGTSPLLLRQKVGIGLSAVGGMTLLTAGALGITTWRAREQYTGMSCADTYHPECAGLYDRGKGLASAQWSTLAVGGALAVTGILLAVLPHRNGRAGAMQPVFGPRHAGIVLRWSF
ncbi:hypothetical protein [Nannocystis radixulma]|uniref:Tetratricopeptide repeat protein n=1 Tax=Nannocystis radixulma TaxID=2995305 RepID=A0ABT5BNM6_9BACT|nr:hypothetical protein [Nannocystis radixulma]MDC0675769.1 hypothetical protein [Nannocystis radixulma]